MKKITLLLLLIAFQMNAQCWKTVSCGLTHTLGIKNDGTLWTWGRNDSGQLGLGNTTNKNTPTQIGSATDWEFVSAGYDTSFAIKTNGTLWGWGDNQFARIGDGTQTDRLSPIQIGTDTNWLSIDSKNHTIALKTDGTLWAWGYNSSGEMGDGTSSGTVYRTLPGQVGTDTNWSTVSAGSNFNVALKTDGTLWAWGNNGFGQLGDGTQTTRKVPMKLGTSTNWQKISAGSLHVMAIKTDGTLGGWGKNDYGQLGIGSVTSYSLYPVQTGTATNWLSICAGNNSNVAIKTDGTLWWGYNHRGQLGDGTLVDKNAPIQIGTATNWSAAVRCTGYLSAALKTDGNLSAWGSNTYGQLGDGTVVNKSIPTAISCPATLSSEDFEVNAFSVYPNPATEFLYIENKDNLSIDTVIIFDLTGKKVIEQKNTDATINVQQLESGIYMVQVISKGRNYLNKFIKD